MKFRLDGQLIQDPIDNVSRVIVREQLKNEDGKLSRGYSEELTFYGNAFQTIKTVLIDDPNGKFNSLKFEIIDDCCGTDNVVFEGIIRGDSIDWCHGECKVDIQTIEDNDKTRALDCLKSRLIYDNELGFQQQAHPRMTYCVEYRPAILQDVVMIFGILMNIMFLLLYPVIIAVWLIVEVINTLIDVINGIINAINSIPGINLGTINNIDIDGDEDTNLLEEYQNMIDMLNENIIGCGRQHPSPLVRDYIQNVCDICGVQWESSIFKDPASQYYNAVYMSAPVEKGTRDDGTTFIAENQPIKTGEGLLEELGELFNADHQFIGNVLHFERKDFFNDGQVWVNYEDLEQENRVTETMCFSWRDEEVPASGRHSYTDDPVDWVGNEARNRYDDLVGFNNPPSPLRKGIRERFFPFSRARFRGDGIDRDVLAAYAWFPIFGNVIDQYDHVLIMNNGTCFQPKILIWDGVSLSNSKVNRYNIPNFVVPGDENFNFPMLCNEHGVASNTAYPADEANMSLYGRFHTIDHPQVLIDQGKSFTFAFTFNCEDLSAYTIDRIVSTPLGPGRITNVEIDYTNRIMTVNGDV